MRTKVNVVSVLFFAFFVFALTALGAKTLDAKTKVKKIKVTQGDNKSAAVAKGKKIKLKAVVTVKPNKKANKKVKYSTSNKKIAVVSSKGVVKGIKAGTCKITVTSAVNKKKKAKIKLKVYAKAVKQVVLKNYNYSLTKGDTKKISAAVSPSKKTCKKLKFTSSNKKIATVSKNGVIKAINDGVAKITVSAIDGSGKKAKLIVNVGVGIKNVTCDNYDLLCVELTGARKLSQNDFKVYTKKTHSAKNYIVNTVDGIESKNDNVYYVSLHRDVEVGDTVKVCINALPINKTYEFVVEKNKSPINATTETIEYETYNKDSTNRYSKDLEIENSMAYGDLTYSISGLPDGIKAYISEDKTKITISGFFNKVEKGTTATLVGVDEKGQKFVKKIIFYVGSNTEIVSFAMPALTEVAYSADDPKTLKDEESGWRLEDYDIVTRGGFAGGTGNYYSQVTYNGNSIDNLLYKVEDGRYSRVSIKPGTYTFKVEAIDYDTLKALASYNVTINLVKGVTLSGTVKDLANNLAKETTVYGDGKKDAYGRLPYFEAHVQYDGTYYARLLPGSYNWYVDFDNIYASCCSSVNNIVSGDMVKNFVVPFYRVKFVTDIKGAKGYEVYNSLDITDQYGRTNHIYNAKYGELDGDYGMISYLKPGTYDVLNERGATDETGTVYVYGEIAKKQKNGLSYFELNKSMGRYKMSGTSFTVTGANVITLHATEVATFKAD